LKKLHAALVSAIETDSIARKKPSHHCGKGRKSGSKKKMCVIRHKYPCVTCSFRHRQEFCQAIEEILSITVVYKYLSTLYPPDHNVVQNTWRV
jgi:hypothetical protein